MINKENHFLVGELEEKGKTVNANAELDALRSGMSENSLKGLYWYAAKRNQMRNQHKSLWQRISSRLMIFLKVGKPWREYQCREIIKSLQPHGMRQ